MKRLRKRRSLPKTVRANNLDRAYAGNPVAYLVGPMRSTEEPDRLRTRLVDIANGGPGNRLGLHPDKGSRRWRFDPDCGSIVITTGAAPDVSDPAATLANLDEMASDVPSVPLHIHLADPWLFLKFDHGLGGGRLFTELIAAIGADDPGFARPVPDATCRCPGLRATVQTLRRNPLRLARSLDEVTRKHHRPNAFGSTNHEVSVAYAHSGPQFLDRIRRARDQRCPGVSLTALVTSQFLQCLQAEGIATEPTVNFVVDLGRYLPRGVGTLSNFVGTAPIDVAAPWSARDLSESLADYTDGARSLVRSGMAYATTLLYGPPANVLHEGDASHARVVITDHANTTAGGKIAWGGSPDGHVFVRKAPVGFTNQITLAINRVESELHLTASFYQPYFEPAKLQRVLEKITTNDNLSRAVGIAV